jgi:hypothetical protein
MKWLMLYTAIISTLSCILCCVIYAIVVDLDERSEKKSRD